MLGCFLLKQIAISHVCDGLGKKRPRSSDVVSLWDSRKRLCRGDDLKLPLNRICASLHLTYMSYFFKNKTLTYTLEDASLRFQLKQVNTLYLSQSLEGSDGFFSGSILADIGFNQIYVSEVVSIGSYQKFSSQVMRSLTDANKQGLGVNKIGHFIYLKDVCDEQFGNHIFSVGFFRSKPSEFSLNINEREEDDPFPRMVSYSFSEDRPDLLMIHLTQFIKQYSQKMGRFYTAFQVVSVISE